LVRYCIDRHWIHTLDTVACVASADPTRKRRFDLNTKRFSTWKHKLSNASLVFIFWGYHKSNNEPTKTKNQNSQTRTSKIKIQKCVCFPSGKYYIVTWSLAASAFILSAFAFSLANLWFLKWALNTDTRDGNLIFFKKIKNKKCSIYKMNEKQT